MSLAHNSPRIITDGLVLYFDAANVKSYPGSGTTITNLANTGVNGTLYNGVGYSALSGGALIFDGTNDYIDINSTNIITGTNPFTFECFYYTDGTNAAELFGNYGSGSTSNTIWVSGRYGVYMNSAAPYFPGAPLSAGTYYMAYTRNSSGSCILYLNGAQVGTATNTTSIVSNAFNFRIGADVNVISEQLSGRIYSLRVYNKVLTASEIKQNYDNYGKRYGL